MDVGGGGMGRWIREETGVGSHVMYGRCRRCTGYNSVTGKGCNADWTVHEIDNGVTGCKRVHDMSAHDLTR